MIHTWIFGTQLFTMPRTYCVLQVILLTANVDYGPKAQVMLPKELRIPNNITCFFLYPEMQCGICLEQLMISRQITRTSSFHEIAWHKLILSDYCSKYRLYYSLRKKEIFLYNISLWRSLIYSSVRANWWKNWFWGF